MSHEHAPLGLPIEKAYSSSILPTISDTKRSNLNSPSSSSERNDNGTLTPPRLNTNLPFHNTDLVDDFCEYLYLDDDASAEEIAQSHATLRALALTCKALLEPALDRLWRSLRYLFPLLKILPAFVQSDGTYVIRGRISPEDWARFDWYGKRVRKFRYERDPDDLDIAMHVYFRVAQLRNTPLLPNLRQLWCPLTSQADFLVSGICLFLSPSLQSIKLERVSGVEDKLCGTFLHTLRVEGAKLESIILRGRGLSRDTLSIAVQFEQIRRLDITGMGASLQMPLVLMIGALPRLSDLTLDFELSALQEIEEDIGFKDLKALKIAASLPFISTFLNHASTPFLESLTIESASNPHFDKKAFIQSIADRWKNTLRHFSLACPDRGRDEELEVLPMSSISPLLPLSNFTSLGIKRYQMAIRDDDIERFARAWPHLRKLKLPASSLPHPSPTIASLRTLANRCPRLQVLRIPLDLSDLPPFAPTTPHPPTAKPDLERLIIASPDDEWEWREFLHLSRHIDYLFPTVKWVVGYDRDDHERWCQVGEMVKMFQAVRSEETRKAMNGPS